MSSESILERAKQLLGLSPSEPSNDNLAVVLSGGGARGAYQAGVLTYISDIFPDFAPGILTGVSAGALNAAYLAASQANSFGESVGSLRGLWSSITTDQVFEAEDSLATAWRLLIRRRSFFTRGGEDGEPRIRGMVDTTPLRSFLVRQLETDENGRISGIETNIERGWLRAIAVLTANYSTGQTNAFVQGSDIVKWDRPTRRSVSTLLGIEHIMASTALPLFFPAIRIGDQWHGDGGIRLTAPLAPALHLGADRLLVISTRPSISQAEADRVDVADYPSTAHIIGILMNAVFLDMLDQDARLLSRINQLVQHLPKRKRNGLRRVEALLIRPSRSLDALVSTERPEMSPGMRLFLRIIGAGQGEGPSWLSMLQFDAHYTESVMACGYDDAARRKDDLEAFLAGEKVPLER